jgi:molecular chaperone DnaJ
MSNPYDILGVSKSATDAEIKAAYRKLVLKHHPDKNSGDKAAEEKFKEINNAFDILKDPQKKAAYDRYGDANAGGAGFNGNPFGSGFGGKNGFSGFEFNMNGFDVSDMMDEVMRGFGFDTGGRHGAKTAAPRGRDMLHEVVIDLADAYFGKSETVRFESNVRCEKCGGQGTRDGKIAPICETCGGSGYVRTRSGIFRTERPCPDCNGTGRKIKDRCSACDSGVIHRRRELKVEIPMGVMDGTRLRLAGMGEAAPFGGASGDFYIDVRVRRHPVFAREGKNLFMKCQIPYPTLALGGKIEITAISGKVLDIKIPDGTQIGASLRIAGAGMAGGDLFIEVATSVPTKLSKEQRRAMEELRIEN